MYIITFYSFKGGVGRTMALVNVAAELVRRGRKVLVVDFDLEAPGLETYKRLRPKKPHPGIVEYVTEFRRTRQVPNLLEYIYEAKPIGKKDGRLWVMPAGRRDGAYRSALASLDWQRLYRDQGGFLLFEDTKNGWEQELKPDYVLIDSRTGDTDVLGICTRQLPDSVVLMFMPNEQNLAGLVNVCRDIRREETEGLKKTIRLHFVAANVPDLADEDGILHRQLAAFCKKLDIPERPEKICKIRRYESALLLNQAVFVLDKPRSRLAHEYKRLLRSLIVHNLADRDGALLVLRKYAQSCLPGRGRLATKEFDPFGLARSRVNRTIDAIVGHFLNDSDMLVAVAEFERLAGNTKRALSKLDWALKQQPDHPKALFDRALCKKSLDDLSGTAEDLVRYLQAPHLEGPQVFRALNELRTVAPDRLLDATRLIDIEAFDLSARWQVATWLADTDPGLASAIEIMKRCLADRRNLDIYDPDYEFTECLIRARRWKETIEILEGDNIRSLRLMAVFNLAMARWGETGDLPEELCRHMLRENEETMEAELERHPDAKAVVLWRLGKSEEALHVLDKATENGHPNQWAPFSYWRYQPVQAEQFVDDCRQLRGMIQGEPLRPAFLGPAPAKSSV